jgi:hypothetical protein
VCDCLENIEVSQAAKLYDASPCLARDTGEITCIGIWRAKKNDVKYTNLSHPQRVTVYENTGANSPDTYTD